MMICKKIQSILIAISVLSALGISAEITPAIAKDKKSIVDCDIQNSSCRKSLPGCDILFDIHPKPVEAMKDLTFRVHISGKEPDGEPFIDLGMPGMNMGRNRVSLNEIDQATYEGIGIIVRCASGRKIWYAKVTIPGIGFVTYTFDVIY